MKLTFAESTVTNKFPSNMKIEDIKKIIPLKKEDISLPLEGLSEEELRAMHEGDYMPENWY